MAKLQWVNEPTRAVRDDEYPISPSATKRYKRCPKQFEYRYFTDKPPTEPAGKYADVGTAVHEAIEQLLRDDGLDSLLQRPNQVRQMLTEEYRDRVPDLDDESIVDGGVSACHTAARYLCLQEPDNVRGVEADFEYALKRPDIDSAFHGTMDVATVSEVWDWKTGKTVREEDEIIQGMLYAMGYYQKFDVVPERVRFVYLHEELEKERVFEPTDEKWQEALSYVKNVVEGKKRQEFPADPESSKCYFCGWSGYCSAFPAGAEEIRYEVF